MKAELINSLTEPQKKIAGLLAYNCFNKHTSNTPEEWRSAINTSRHACSLIGIPDEIILTILSGYVEGLPNPARLSGGNFKENYSFNPY